MSEPISRRSFLRGLALGGAVIAGELWIPGAKTISIPKLPQGVKFERYTYKTYGISVAYTREMLTQAEYDRLCQRYTEALIRSMEETKDQLVAGILRQSFDEPSDFHATWEDSLG